MNKTLQRILFWAPRILGILFAIFLSLFSLDIFSMGYGFWNTLLGLLIHLIPTLLIIILLLVAWRWEWLGGVLFIVAGLIYLFMIKDNFNWGTAALISAPLIVVGALFLVSKYSREKKH